MWNICTKIDHPTLLIQEGDVVPDGYIVEATTANPNYVTDIAAPVPQEVSMRQAQQALLQAGMLDTVEQVVSQADRAVQIDWQKGQTVRRDWSALKVVQSMLNMTERQVDELFILAGSL